ncbi:ABC transporter permease [Sinorhizobium meliloti]|uniref:ABC transporter permease n=1 Tax=Rhizobium meliloti TaxID=382 RepID=UPI003D65D5A6
MTLVPHATPGQRIGHYGLRITVALICAFLILPILVVLPLSFNAEPYFTFPIKQFSLQWYDQLFQSENWRRAAKNSLIVAVSTSIIATTLGTLAAIGLHQLRFRFKGLLLGLLISPLIVPVIVTAVGMYFFLSAVNLTGSLVGLVVAHTVLATPFVVVTVSSGLASFDMDLPRAAASLGAKPLCIFFRITAPLLMPSLFAGAIFAFVTSFDDAVVSTFLTGPEQHTLPREMWKGIRQQISPVILCAASILVVISVGMLSGMEWLRRRGARLRGMKP